MIARGFGAIEGGEAGSPALYVKRNQPDRKTAMQPLVDTCQDILLQMAQNLSAQHGEVLPHQRVDLTGLFEGVPSGPEYLAINELLDRCASAGLIETSGGMGQGYALTEAGAYQAVELLERHQTSGLGRVAIRIDDWVGKQRRLIPNIAPFFGKGLGKIISYVGTLILGFLLGWWLL